MNVGLPGAGLAGLFYIITALLMPLLELARTLVGKSSFNRWRLVWTQVGLALGVIGALWLTAWLMKFLLPDWLIEMLRRSTHRATDWFGVAPTFVTVSTLAAVLVAAEALRLLLARESQKA